MEKPGHRSEPCLKISVVVQVKTSILRNFERVSKKRMVANLRNFIDELLRRKARRDT